jgi:O-antigen/teichoic acid export membrane protein
LTLSSLIGWFSFFDIGLGNGMRIKLSEAIAENNTKMIKTYVSTTYAILVLILLGVYVIFLTINHFLDWTIILNADSGLADEIKFLTLFVFTFFVVRLVVDLFNSVLIADQRIALYNFLGLIGSLISVVVILTLIKTTTGSLLYLGLSYSAIPVLVGLAASFYFYSHRYKEYAPTLKFVDFSYARDLATLGFKFFFLQITAIVLFAVDNLIIAHTMNPLEVTKYNIAQKYFSIITIFYGIMFSPFVPAFAEAYYKKDFVWIRKVAQKSQKLWLLCLPIVMVMILSADTFYRIWVGKEIRIPIILSIFMGLSVVVNMWNSIYMPLINGVGKVTLQMYLAAFTLFLNVPLSIYFVRNLKFGSAGVVLVKVLLVSMGSFFMYTQFYKILNNPRGIWNK